MEPRWPPRSPHEALLSSPTGRQKIRQYHDRTSPSPSPLKKTSSTASFDRISQKSYHRSPIADDDEDDEETLQLELAAIEAKLKLKKLQQKSGKAVPSTSRMDGSPGGRVRPAGKEIAQPQIHGSLDRPVLSRPKLSADIQVPISPQRKRVAPEEARSPGRVLLGIDKGLKGRNISLRRPVGETAKDEDPFRNAGPAHSISSNLGALQSPSAVCLSASNKPKSFSEKIAETRKQDKAEKERADKLRRQRSTGFGIKQQEIDSFGEAAERRSKVTDSRSKVNPAANGEYSRDEILKAASQAPGGLIHRSNTSAGLRRSRTHGNSSTDIWINPNAPPEAPQLSKTEPNASKKRIRSPSPPSNATETSPLSNSEASSLFEPFASLHLSKRLLPHDFLTRTFSEKHIFRLPDLLGAVKSPDYCLPDISEPDYIVLAIIASKSNPLTHKGAHKTTEVEKTSTEEAIDSEQNTNGKYMVLTLTDLKWTVDLFLFTTAYTRFRKLTPGTVVALLNPDVMPPPPGKADTGRFSLKLASSDDTVLEIGTSRDLAWCKSVRKDGKQCSSWIDKRHTEFCEFHVDVVVERTRRRRMEVQGMSAPFAPGGRKGGRTGNFGEKRRQKPPKEDGFIREGAQYDRSSGSRYFVGPPIPGGRSAAQLIDAEGAIERGGSKEERVRKRLAEREKENEIARKLGEGGNGAGSEYLRVRQGGEALGKGYADPQALDPVDAMTLGLLGNRATNVHLSPIKKRKASGLGGADGSRKKTRFVTDRGIKEAGRESFGGDFAEHTHEEDDDDGLEVV